MNGFRSALRIIPRTAWIIAAAMYTLPVAFVVLVAAKAPVGLPEALAMVVGASFLAAYVLLVGYISADSRRRGMRSGLWTLLSIIIPHGIGAILYFLVRDPLPVPCPECGSLVKPGFPYCPSCGHAVGRVCAGCGRPLEGGWAACPHCGKHV